MHIYIKMREGEGVGGAEIVNDQKEKGTQNMFADKCIINILIYSSLVNV